MQARRGDWLRVSSPLGPENRPLWVRFEPDAMWSRTTPWSIEVDLSERTLRLFRGRELDREVDVAVGAAGSSTPAGSFAVTDVIVRDLDPVYGCCALALTAHQPNLPDGWIGGDRVAIHGTPGAGGTVGVAASAGCIRVRDRELISIVRRAGLGTPVTIEG